MTPRLFARVLSAGFFLLGFIIFCAPKRRARRDPAPATAVAEQLAEQASRSGAPRGDGKLHVRVELDGNEATDVSAALEVRLFDGYGGGLGYGTVRMSDRSRPGIEFAVAPPTTPTYLLAIWPRQPNASARVIAWGPDVEGREQRGFAQARSGEPSCFYIRAPQANYYNLTVMRYFQPAGCDERVQAWVGGKTGTDYYPDRGARSSGASSSAIF